MHCITVHFYYEIHYLKSGIHCPLCVSFGLDKNAADVVCRQLGCGEADHIPNAGIYLAGGHTTMISVKCTGSEKHLWKCEKTIKGNCSDAAGVICSSKPPASSSSCQSRDAGPGYQHTFNCRGDN